MKFVRIALALGLVGLAWNGWREFEQHSYVELSTDAVTLSVAAGLLAALGGLAVWQARPNRATGPLLAVAGGTTMLSSFAWYIGSAFLTVAWIVWACLPLVPAHLLLAHPDGVPRRWRSTVVAACWLVPAGLGWCVLAFAGSWRPRRLFDQIQQSPTPFSLADRPALAHTVAVARWLWIVVIAVAACAVAMRRARRSRGAVRSACLPVAWAGVGWAAAEIIAAPTAISGAQFGTDVATREELRLTGMVLPSLAVLVVAGAVVWVDLVRPRLDPGRDGHIHLSGPALPTGEFLRRELARTVGDPALRLAYATRAGAWIGSDGRPIALRDDRDRAVTSLTRDATAVAMVEHDVGLKAAPDLLRVAMTMAGLAIDNDRLTALDAAQLEETRASGARLLAAGERARADLEAMIDRGPARQLTAIAAQARAGADPIVLQRGLRGVVEQIRTISHGLAPTELAEHGLASALPDVPVGSTRRFPRAVELTAYLVTVDHAGARIVDEGEQLVICLPDNPAETAADRVAALGGTVRRTHDGFLVTIPIGA